MTNSTTNSPAERRTIHLCVYDGFADWEPAFAVAGLNDADFQREPGRWQVKTVSVGGKVARSMGNLAVLPDLALEQLDPADSAMFILPGGNGWGEGEHMAEAAKAKQLLDAGVPVAAICGATAGLAKLGALDERRHTSNALAYLKWTGYGGSDRYENVDAFSDGQLVTAGGMAPLEFAREIFRLLGVFEPAALDDWYALYKTGQSKFFAKLQHDAHPPAAS